MSVPPLRLDTNFDSYISGEVIIHPSAVMAPGVILQAATNSKIIIGPGVCIGMGSILQTNAGIIQVEAGVSLGAGFLMVGEGRIGANACIGSATTVFNCSVQPGQVIAPGSILTYTTEHTALSASTTIETKQLQPSPTLPASGVESENGTVETDFDQSNLVSDSVKDEAITTTADGETPSSAIGSQIYGQGSIQRLLVTLFPHRQSLNESNGDRSE